MALPGRTLSAGLSDVSSLNVSLSCCHIFDDAIQLGYQ